MTYRILCYALFILTGAPLYFAYEQHEAGKETAKKLGRLEGDLAGLRAEERELSRYPVKPILPKDTAMADLVLNMRTEADLLGGTVRLGRTARGQPWVKFKHGLESAKLKLDVTALDSAAPAVLAMSSRLALSRALRIQTASITALQDTITMTLGIELFGRTP